MQRYYFCLYVGVVVLLFFCRQAVKMKKNRSF